MYPDHHLHTNTAHSRRMLSTKQSRAARLASKIAREISVLEVTTTRLRRQHRKLLRASTSLPNSLFRAPIIQQVFNYNWFGDGTFSRGSYFAGEAKVPLVTVALVMTAVDCIFDSWTSGKYGSVKFSADKYGPQHRQNLKRLQEWKGFTEKEEEDLVNMLQEDLLRNARAAAGLALEVSQEGDETDEETMLAAFRANQAV
ncbi:hypothetical protein BDZ97DRAFT_128546 [Flammula alnicola]|nr:hypothetical protein BDZ97DRAFT_128546 [Flammula alnicola]